MNEDDNVIHKCYAPFLSSNNHEEVYSESEYASAKQNICRIKNTILDIILKKPKILNVRYHCYFSLSTTGSYHNIWLRLLNTLTPKITKFIPLSRWAK